LRADPIRDRDRDRDGKLPTLFDIGRLRVHWRDPLRGILHEYEHAA
jgi:hypothetical protein